MNTIIKPKTVKLIARFIKPLAEEGLITVPEVQEIIANLKHLAEKGEAMPMVQPKFIDQLAAAEMLGLGHSNFKKLEREGSFPFKRKMVGSAVRYLNLDLIKYMMTDSVVSTDKTEDVV